MRSSTFMQFLYQAGNDGRHFLLQQPPIGQHFIDVQQKHRHLFVLCLQAGMQGQFVQSVGFAQQAFGTVALHGLFKMPATYAHAHFHRVIQWFGWLQVNHFYREHHERFAFAKKLLQQFAALELFLFSVCKCCCDGFLLWLQRKSPTG